MKFPVNLLQNNRKAHTQDKIKPVQLMFARHEVTGLIPIYISYIQLLTGAALLGRFLFAYNLHTF